VPREPRVYIEKVLYLVTARGDEDRLLFNDPQDFSEYLKPLSEYKREYGFKLFAFAILPKRLCLLIELKNNVTISTIMHNLNSKYTKTYNSRYGKKGHLFQSRFKSILVEKEDYLLRLTRYIHLLPRDSGVSENPSEYPYSSYQAYISGSDCHCEARSAEAISEDNHEIASLPSVVRNDIVGGEYPDMADEIKEVLNHFSEAGADADKQKAYEAYVQSADDEEMEIVQKLLHRTAFVGSKDFVKGVRNRIEKHIVEEEESRTIRKSNPVFVLTGSFVALFLGVVAYNFHNNQSSLQDALHVTTSGFEVAREDLTKRVYSLQEELTKLEDTDELDGAAWEIRITPLNESNLGGVVKDVIYFNNDQVVIKSLGERGFSAFNYTLTPKSPGRMVWRVAKTQSDGTNIRMEGLWTGKKVKGVVRERPAQGEGRDFTFTSVRRVKNLGRTQNVVQ